MLARSSFALVAIALGTIACGSLLGVSDEEAPAASDAGVDATGPVDGSVPDGAPSVDGSVPIRRCDVTGPFHSPVVQSWVPAGVTAARFGTGGRVYLSAEDGSGHFLVAGTVAPGGTFTASTAFDAADPDRTRDDTQPAITADELTVLWQSRVNGWSARTPT